MIAVAGDAPSDVAPTVEVLRDRLRSADLAATYETLDHVDVATIVTPGLVLDTTLARIWIDWTKPERVTLYVVDGSWERILVRHIARHANPEVTREGIGHIVEFALLALRAGERIGMGRESVREELMPTAAAPPAPVAPPASPDVVVLPQAPPPARFAFRGGVFYEVMAYGGGPDIASGPGAAVGLFRETPRRAYGLELTGQYRLPTSSNDGRSSLDTQVRVEGGSFRAMATVALPLARQTSLLPSLGGGVDLVFFRATGVKGDGVRFTDSSSDVAGVVRAAISVDHRTSAVRWRAGLGVDVPTRGMRFVANRDGQSEELFAPWSIRPFLFLGIETP